MRALRFIALSLGLLLAVADDARAIAVQERLSWAHPTLDLHLWSVSEIDGHAADDIHRTLTQTTTGPRVVILRTVKGKGVSFMENRVEWHYLPLTDVRMDLLRDSDTSTQCPYKGQASYYSVELDGELFEDIVWYYKYPVEESSRIAGMVSFYNEMVDIFVDGEPEDRPMTMFS